MLSVEEILGWLSSRWYRVACLLDQWGVCLEYVDGLRTAEDLRQTLQALEVVHQGQ